ncbi:MAG: hypothetical protein [Bacteriophage sp.]|nr:MAG: hypothetical protein [Bacteriophage sp.]
MKWINVEDAEPKDATRKLCFGWNPDESPAETFKFFAHQNQSTGKWFGDDWLQMRVIFWMDGPEDPQ